MRGTRGDPALSFDDIFTLLLFVLFIGLPLFSRLRQRGRPGAPPPGGPGRQPGQVGPSGRPTPSTRTGGPPTMAGRERDEDERAQTDRPPGRVDSDDPFDDLGRRLEEARRRVRDAMGDSAADPEARGRTIADVGQPSGTLSGGTPRPTVAGGRTATTVAGRPIGTTGPTSATPATPPAPFLPSREARQRPDISARELAARARQRSPVRKTEAPALEVDRTVGRSPYGAPGQRSRRDRRGRAAEELVRLDDASVRKGFLWHMILGRAAAFERGRMPSPRRPSR